MFQFTHPGKGATRPTSAPRRTIVSFNSRTPGGVRRSSAISSYFGCGFNSRTPGGVRPKSRKGLKRYSPFQFTHPGRGATNFIREHTRKVRRFNSRTPGGVRLLPHLFRNQDKKFQFTHPGRGATVSVAIHVNEARVSIHAPREGCDLF